MLKSFALVVLIACSTVSAFNHDRRALQYSNTTTTVASTLSSASSQLYSTESLTSSLPSSASSSSSLLQSSSASSVSAPSSSLFSGSSSAYSYTSPNLVNAPSPASSTSSLPSSTTATNSTTISASITAAPNATLPYCCSQGYQEGIGLVAWYTGPQVNVTVATEISIYAQYNNTLVLETVSTVTIANATAFYGTYGVDDIGYSTIATRFPGIPNTLVPWGDNLYGSSVIGSATEVVFPHQSLTITSPTPFWYFNTIPFFTGVSTSGQTSGGCSSYYTEFSSTTVTTSDTTFVSEVPLATSYGAWPSYEGGQGQEENIDIQGPVVVPYTGNLSEWLCEDCGTGESPGDSFVYFSGMIDVLADTPYFASQFPQVGSCQPISAGEGAPTVHIPVSELVATTTSVITRSGIYTETSSTSIDTASAEVLTPAPSLKPSTSFSLASSAEVLTPASGLTTSETSVASFAEVHTPAPGLTTSTSVSGSQTPETAEVLTPASQVETTPSVETTQVSSTPPTAFPPHLGVSESSLDTPSTSKIETVASATIVATALPEKSGSDSNTPSTAAGAGEATEPAQPETSVPDSNPPSTTNNAGGATGPAAVKTTPSTNPISWVSTIAIQPSSSVAESQGILPILTFDSTTASPDSSSQYDIGGGQTLSPNGPAVTNGGNTYSLSIGASATALISNGVTSVVAAPSSVNTEAVAAPAPVITIGSAVVTQNSASQYIVPSSVAGGSSDQTIAPGGSAIVAAGTTYSIPSDGTAVVVNGKTSAIATPAGAIVTFGSGSESNTAGVLATPVGSSGVYVIAGQTVTAGGAAVVADGSTYAIPSAGTAVVVNGDTSALATPVAAFVTLAPESGDNAGAVVATPVGNSAYVLAGQTLSPGGSAIVVGGTTYSLASSAAVGSGAGSEAIVINGITSPLPAATAAGGIPATPIGSSGGYMIAGQTLIPGGSAIIAAGTTYSLASGTNGVIVVNGATSTLAAAGLAPGVLATPIGSSGEYVIAGQTLSPGGTALTLAGTTYSLASGTAGSSEVVVINGVTSPLPTPNPTTAAIPTPSQETDYILGDQTLRPGSPALTISGTTISLAAKGSTVYINGKASTLPTPESVLESSGVLDIAGIPATLTLGPSPFPAEQSDLTIDNTIYTFRPTTISGTPEVIIGSQTLVPAAIITIGDSILSLAAGGVGVLIAEGIATGTSGGRGVAGAILSVLEAGNTGTVGEAGGSGVGTGTVTVHGSGTTTVIKTTTSGTKSGSQITSSPILTLSTTGPPGEGETKTSSSKGAAAAVVATRGKGSCGGLVGAVIGLVALL